MTQPSNVSGLGCKTQPENLPSSLSRVLEGGSMQARYATPPVSSVPIREMCDLPSELPHTSVGLPFERLSPREFEVIRDYYGLELFSEVVTTLRPVSELSSAEAECLDHVHRYLPHVFLPPQLRPGYEQRCSSPAVDSLGFDPRDYSYCPSDEDGEILCPSWMCDPPNRCFCPPTPPVLERQIATPPVPLDNAVGWEFPEDGSHVSGWFTYSDVSDPFGYPSLATRLNFASSSNWEREAYMRKIGGSMKYRDFMAHCDDVMIPRFIAEKWWRCKERGTPFIRFRARVSPLPEEGEQTRAHQNAHRRGFSKALASAVVEVRKREVLSGRAPSSVWRVPGRSACADLVRRPVVYSRASFRDWVHGQAQVLSRSIRRKTQVVAGNHACQCLYGNFAGSPALARELLSRAAVFLYDYAAPATRGPVPCYLEQWLPPPRGRHVLLHGRYWTSPESLREAPAWSTHRRLLEVAQCYLGGADIPDLDGLRVRLARITERFSSVQLQGNVQSSSPPARGPSPRPRGGIGLSHEVHIEGISEIATALVDLCESEDQTSLARQIVAIAALCYNVYRAQDAAAVTGIVVQFIAGNSFLWGMVSSLLGRLRSGVSLQGDTVDSAEPPSREASERSGRSIVAEILTVCGLTTLFDHFKSASKELFVPLIYELAASVRKQAIHASAESFVQSIFGVIVEGFTRLNECVKTGSFDPLWGERYSPYRLKAYMAGYMRYSTILCVVPLVDVSAPERVAKLVAEGAIPKWWSGPVSRAEFTNRCETLRDDAQTTLAAMSSHSPQARRELEVELMRFEGFLAVQRVQCAGAALRVAPYCLYLHGPPGTGKSNLVATICKAVCNIRGLEFSPEMMYYYQDGVNFQDGLTQSTMFVVMDDPDHSAASPQAGTRSHIQMFNDLSNNKPFPVEAADLGSKGRVFAHPLIVIYCSNFADGRASHFSMQPDAFGRRFHHFLEVKVKPAFRLPNSERMDPAKVSEATTHNVFQLRCAKFNDEYSLNRASGMWTSFHTVELGAFMRVFQEGFKRHFTTEAERIIKATAAVGFCGLCGLDAVLECKCTQSDPKPEKEPTETVELQGNTGSTVTTGTEEVWDEERTACPPCWTCPRRRTFVAEPEILPVDWTLAKIMFRDYGGFVESEFEKRLKTARELFPEEDLDLIVEMPIEPGMYPYALECAKTRSRAANPLWRAARVVESTAKTFADSVRERLPGHPGMAAVVVVLGSAAIGTVLFLLRALQLTYRVLQGRVENVVPGWVSKSWMRAECEYQPGIPGGFGKGTWTLPELCATVRKSYLSVKGTGGVMFAVVFSQNLILVPSHLCAEGESFEIKMPTEPLVVKRTKATWFVLNHKEMSVAYVPTLPPYPALFTRFQLTPDAGILTFDRVVLIRPESMDEARENAVIRLAEGNTLKTDLATVPGECGLLYAAEWNGTWRLVASHYALFKSVFGPSSAMACIVSRQEVERFASAGGISLQGVDFILRSFVPEGEPIVGVADPRVSELRAAHTHFKARFVPAGTLFPGMAGSSMKSSIESSLIREDFADFEAEHCGAYPYWQVPNFRGRMEDERFTSSFTTMFKHQNWVVPDHELMMLAVKDFLTGVADLDCSGYARLTGEQAIVGVPGSVIGAMNLATSFGPPWKGPKHNHIVRDVAAGTAYVSPEFFELRADILKMLEVAIPSVVALGCLKDEAIKPGARPRVFWCLSAAMNSVMKEFGAAWKSFMRMHMEFFESAVGTNMTSLQCNKIAEILRSIDPELARIYAGDIAKMDKAWSGPLYDYVALVVYALAFAIQVCPLENYRLLLAMKHCTYCVKNDLAWFFNNVSGSDWTVEMNCILLSLCFRYVYYREHGFQGDWDEVRRWMGRFFESPIPDRQSGVDFRLNVALVDYGDDSDSAHRKPPTSRHLSIWLEELGLTVTDPYKTESSALIPRPLAESPFLKRSLVWCPLAGSFLPRLAKKSMTRTLAMRRRSVLGRDDHAATVLTEVMREMVYYPEEEYEAFRVRAHAAAVKHKLLQNGYYVERSWAEWREDMMKGNFQTWSTRDAVDPPLFEEKGELVLQGTRGDRNSRTTLLTTIMSSSNLVNGDSASHNDSAVPAVRHPVGEIVSSLPTETESLPVVPYLSQRMPSADLGTFLQRPVKIYHQTLAATDSPGVPLLTIDPYHLFMSDPTVQSKTANFAFFRGSIRVSGVLTTPAGSFGSYVVTALPDAGATRSIAQVLSFPNILQTDFNAILDVATSQDFSFDLPFLYKYDYGGLPATSGDFPNYMWSIYLTTLVPMSKAVASGVVTGSLCIYASMLSDVELVMPMMQGLKDASSKPSYIAGRVGTSFSSLGDVPVIGRFASIAGQALGGISTILDAFGFTREPAERAPIVVTQRSVSSVAHLSGPDLGDSACLLPPALISYDPRLAGVDPADHASFSALEDRWTLTSFAALNPSQTAGTNLLAIPVTPLYARGSAGTYQFSTAGYMAFPFQYWRADMEYLFVIPVSSFHRCKLQVFFTPMGGYTTADPTNTTQNVIFDVEAGVSNIFRVGYCSNRPYLISQPLLDDTPTLLSAENCMGHLRVRIVNPLVSQDLTAGTIIYVFSRARNLQVGQPRQHITLGEGVSTSDVEMRGSIYFQGALGDEPQSIKTHTLVDGGGSIPGKDLYFGEEVRSMRALLQKFSQIGCVEVEENVNFTQMPYGTPAAAFDNLSAVSWTWQTYAGCIFAGMAGSERFKLFPSFETWAGANRADLTTVARFGVSTVAPMTFCGPNRGAEFSVPYYIPMKFVTLTSSPPYSRLSYVAQPGTTTPIPMVVYHAFGPDARLLSFRQIPKVLFDNANLSADWWPTA